MQGETSSCHSHPWHLPFAEFVRYAVEKAELEPESWRTPLWDFTRLIKGWCREGVKAGEAFRQVDAVMRRNGGWGRIFELEPEEARAEFCNTWKKIRFRPDETPLDQALAKAKAYPVKAPRDETCTVERPKYDRFISLCGWLQVTMGDRPIFLPVRQVAALLETDIRMVSLWRQAAVDEGFLEVVKEHEFRPGGRGRATEFRVTKGYLAWFEGHLQKKLH